MKKAIILMVIFCLNAVVFAPPKVFYSIRVRDDSRCDCRKQRLLKKLEESRKADDLQSDVVLNSSNVNRNHLESNKRTINIVQKLPGAAQLTKEIDYKR